MEKLLELYRHWCGKEPATTVRLPGAGSNREYYRMAAADGTTVVGCVGTSAEENHAFVYLSGHFAGLGLPVPQVLAVSEDETRYLQTDLGDTSLFDAVGEGRREGGHYSAEEVERLRRAIRLLPRFQVEGARGLDFSQCYPQAEFDEDTVMFDLNYFKYCFLKATGVDFHEARLEADFRQLARDLTSERQAYFLYRDFQPRNVMLADGGEYFIDFQGGRRGPLYYDVASFLFQASARYPRELREELLDEYCDALSQYAGVPDGAHIRSRLPLFVLFRLLQVLGAYGFRGYFERKRHFLDSIIHAIQSLRELLQTSQGHFSYLHLIGVLLRLCDLQQFLSATTRPQPVSRDNGPGPLVVRVYSFSYRRGLPEDETGNGGGYVFDCRATHNPGRYEPYRGLTGLDEPVVRFLEENGEITVFLEHVYEMADAHVARYMERGFTSLMFAFGCTGGQHRSVYAAQHLAEHLHAKFGIEVRLCHREQGITQTLSGGV